MIAFPERLKARGNSFHRLRRSLFPFRARGPAAGRDTRVQTVGGSKESPAHCCGVFCPVASLQQCGVVLFLFCIIISIIVGF